MAKRTTPKTSAETRTNTDSSAHPASALAVPAPRTRKDGARRLTPKDTRDDATSATLAACTNADQMADLARSWGIREDEIARHAEQAPNFGQFRMVLGNRIRGTERRLAAFGGDRALAAYPNEARKAASAAARAEKAKAKAAALRAKADALEATTA